MVSLFEYSLLFQPIFVCFIQTYIFYKSLRILRIKNLNQKLSPTLVLFFIYLCVLSVLQTIYKFYTIIFWRPDKILYNQQMLYGLGISPWMLMSSNPIFEICFCFERCFAVCFPGSYNEKSRRNICILCIFLFFTYIASNTWINDLTNPQWDKAEDCQHFSCIVYSIANTHIFMFKIILSAINLLSAFFLLFLIKLKFRNVNIQGKRNNYAIIFVIFVTVTFEFSPDLLDFIFKQVSLFVSILWLIFLTLLIVSFF